VILLQDKDKLPCILLYVYQGIIVHPSPYIILSNKCVLWCL